MVNTNIEPLSLAVFLKQAEKLSAMDLFDFLESNKHIKPIITNVDNPEGAVKPYGIDSKVRLRRRNSSKVETGIILSYTLMQNDGITKLKYPKYKVMLDNGKFNTVVAKHTEITLLDPIP